MIISPLGFAQVKPCYVKCHAVTIQFFKIMIRWVWEGLQLRREGIFNCNKYLRKKFKYHFLTKISIKVKKLT